MNFATTKERILQYIDYKDVSVANFFIKTGIKRGFLDSDKLMGSVSDVFIAKIIAAFPDINLYWLITGEGKMIIENNKFQHEVEKIKQDVLNEPTSDYNILNVLNNQIEELKKDKAELIKDKEKLYNLLETKMGKGKAS